MYISTTPGGFTGLRGPTYDRDAGALHPAAGTMSARLHVFAGTTRSHGSCLLSVVFECRRAFRLSEKHKGGWVGFQFKKTNYIQQAA